LKVQNSGLLEHLGPDILSKYLMAIPNAQLQGLGLCPAVPGSEEGDHDAPPALVSLAHPVRALAAGTHSNSPSVEVLYSTPVYLHGVAMLLNITEV